MNKSIKVAILMVPFVTSCLYGNGITKHIVDASKLSSTFNAFVVGEFSDSLNYIYEYLNLAKDEDNNFLFADHGYLLSKNGIPDNIMSLSNNEFIVYGVNGTEEIEIEYSTKIENDIETFEYNLTGYNNFKIKNTETSEKNLGTIVFWC